MRVLGDTHTHTHTHIQKKKKPKKQLTNKYTHARFNSFEYT